MVRFVAVSLLAAVTFSLGGSGGSVETKSASASALYDRGRELRTQGLKELARAAAEPDKAAQHRDAARRQFEDAARQFAQAAEAFISRVKDASLTRDVEWSACACCAQAEMLLRAGKASAARDTAKPILEDIRLGRSKYRDLALYYHGTASFLLKDYVTAGRSLNPLAPFRDPAYGTHARYLLARVHHLTDERPEAAAHYAGVQADYEVIKKDAAAALESPDHFGGDPDGKALREALRDGPPPDHVVRAAFCLGVLFYEGARFEDARARFADFLNRYGESPLRDAAQFCLGCCQVQLNQCGDAVQTLQSLTESKAVPTGQVLLWLGKAQAGRATPTDPVAYRQALDEARATLRRAAEAYRTAADSEGKARRGEALLEWADAHQQVGQDAEAAILFGQILTERLLPAREEELLQRRLSALSRAGRYEESDSLGTQFRRTYPASTLLPEVLFRQAENAQARLAAAGKVTDPTPLIEETARRYREVIERFPDFAHVQRARYGLALTHYRKGEYDKAREVVETIAGPDRSGDLAVASYLLAECLLRLAPTHADDALAAGRLEEQLKTAADLLTGYVNDPPEPPLAADALLRLGFCQHRLAGLLANDDDKNKLRTAARTTYERLLIDFPLHELQAHAALERAKCLAQAGETEPALRHLRRFAIAPLKKTPVAPLAVLQLATLLRAQENKAGEAARLLAECRREYEPALAQDRQRAGWVPLLQVHHAVCLKEAGNLPQARALLTPLLQGPPDQLLTAEAGLRWAQCLNEEGWQKIDEARDRVGQNLPPEEAAQANKLLAEGKTMVRDAVRHLETQAERLRSKEWAGELPAVMLYEAAWVHRRIGDIEAAGVRGKMQEALAKQLQEEAARKAPKGEPVPQVAPPEVPWAKVPLQPGEKQAREVYARLLEAFPDLPLTHDARLELGEILAERGEPAAAIKLLHEALDKEPPAGLAARIRLRLGASELARGEVAAALKQFEVVCRDPDTGVSGPANLRAAECLLRANRGAEAVPHLVVFRDQEAFQTIAGLSDRALVQLGHTLGRLGQWDESRRAYEQVPARFNDSPWLEEARYGVAWTLFHQKDHAKAMDTLRALPADKATEPAARAQLLLGACLVEQRKYADAAAVLEAVPGKYAFAELNALALLQAAHARFLLGQRDTNKKLLHQAINKYPGTAAVVVAQRWLRGDHSIPPHILPVGTRLLTPEVTQPLPLEPSGQQSHGASLDDPTADASLAAALNRGVPGSLAPAPLLHLEVPDPFEPYAVVGHLVATEDDLLPFTCSPKKPQAAEAAQGRRK